MISRIIPDPSANLKGICNQSTLNIGASCLHRRRATRRRKKKAEYLIAETVHAHFAILTAGRKPTVAETDTGHWAGMAGEGALAFTGSGIPDLDHPVFRTGHDSESISTERPNALEVTEEGTQAATGRGLPETNGGI